MTASAQIALSFPYKIKSLLATVCIFKIVLQSLPLWIWYILCSIEYLGGMGDPPVFTITGWIYDLLCALRFTVALRQCLKSLPSTAVAPLRFPLC